MIGLAEVIRNWLSSAFLLSLAIFCISGHFQTSLKLHLHLPTAVWLLSGLPGDVIP